MTKEEFNVLAAGIPTLPGVYKYFDASKKLLYIGKAKNLNKRVRSYFNKNLPNKKTLLLVAQIAFIEYTVTDTEHDAFLLESALIKHFQPRFNIDLKDDKSFPFIVIKNEHFPRVFFTRQIIKDGSEYLGPFTSVGLVRELLDLIKQNIPLRNCTLNLNPREIQKGKYKVCLEYHLGNCKGPCEGLQSEMEYAENLQYIRHILKGNLQPVIKALRDEMMQCAAALEFEKSEVLKQKIAALQQYQLKSTVVNPKLNNIDVLSIVSDATKAYVNFMMLHNGTIIYTNSIAIEKVFEDEKEEDILALAYSQFYEKLNSKAEEVISAFKINLPKKEMHLTIPKLGDKKKLLEMSFKNLTIFKDELRRKESLMLGASEPDNRALLERLQQHLGMSVLPKHIECFDNSNFQGAYPVAAMVCFREAKASPKDYRHFHIKSVEGIDDFASMKEVVYRRYKRLLKEGHSLPQLIIIDGGKGQLGAAMESIKQLGIEDNVFVIGLAKREETVFFPGRSEGLQMAWDSEELLLLRRIRDEVHRFGIQFHRHIRQKGTIKNELETIVGIGPQNAEALLKAFKSVKKISTLTERELTRVVGASKAALVWQHFHDS